MKNILIIIKKELGAYFNNPTAYIALVSFLLLWEFLFFRNAFMIGTASLNSLFMLLPWVFLLIIPALTMGTIAQEKSEGTIELLLSRPLKEYELIIGKFLASSLFLAIALLFSIPIAYWFSSLGNFDWGVFWGQYLASLLFAATLSALGIFVSSVFKSQISALLVTAVASFFLIIVGLEFVTSRLSLNIVPFLEQLSVLTHFESMSRGVIDLRDLWYFISASASFLFLAHLLLLKNKFGNQKKIYKTFQLATAIVIGIAILTNVIGSRIPGRIDLTEEKIYTLSQTTKDTLKGLDDVVAITFYSSNKLPAQLQPRLREVKDILRDYQTLGEGNISLQTKYPSTDQKVAKEAQSLGVQEVRFNVVNNEEFKIKTGYLGLNVSYGGENETIPFIQGTNDLEYQLTSFIKKLTIEDKKKVAFLSGHGEKALSTDFQTLRAELSKQFILTTIAPQAPQDELSKAVPPTTPETAVPGKLVIPEDIDVLVIAGPNQKLTEQERDEIERYLAEGGNALLLVDGVEVMIETLSVNENKKSLADFIQKNLGVNVESNLVYDLRSNSNVQFSNGMFPISLPYPLWPEVVKVSTSSPITNKLERVTYPWGSSLTIDENSLAEKSIEIEKLLSTTKTGGVQSGQFDLNPEQQYATQNLKEILVALSATNTSTGSRFVVAGDSDFIADKNMRSPGNLAFGMESISWLAQEASLSEIQFRNQVDRKLEFSDESQPNRIKFSNLAIAIILPVGFGALRTFKRKEMKKRKYGN